RNEVRGDLTKWAKLIADCLLCHSKGCDYYTFRDALRSVPILDDALDEETIIAAIHDVTRIFKRRGTDYRHIGNSTAGKWLALTAEERKRHCIVTVRAIDETPEDRKAENRENDRKRKREARRKSSKADKQAECARGRRRRAATGAKPHGESLSQTQPWALDGISRRQWERRRAAKTSTPETCRKNVRPPPSYGCF